MSLIFNTQFLIAECNVNTNSKSNGIFYFQLSYRSPNAILAQLNNCYLELVLRFSSKNISTPSDNTGTRLSQNIPARCHYCRM